MNNAGYSQQQPYNNVNNNAWMTKNPKQLVNQIQGISSQDDDLKNILLNMAS